MSDEKLYEKIEAYLSGNMSNEALKAFEEELEKDEQLAAEVALHRGMSNAILEEEEIDGLKEQINAVFEADRKTEVLVKQLKPRSFKYLRLVAAIAILIVFGFIIYNSINTSYTPNLEALFLEELDLPKAIPTTEIIRSINENKPKEDSIQREIQNLWTATNQNYQERDYENALGRLDQLASIETEYFDSISSSLFYFRGIVQLQREAYTEAVIDLENVRLDYIEEAKWKRALILLTKLDRKEEAVLLLEEIKDNGFLRKDDAIEIFQKLNINVE